MLLAVLVIPAIYIVLRGSAPGVWGAVCADALPPMAQNTAAALATINLIVTSLVFLTKASPGQVFKKTPACGFQYSPAAAHWGARSGLGKPCGRSIGRRRRGANHRP